jgi:hypothetical protein
MYANTYLSINDVILGLLDNAGFTGSGVIYNYGMVNTNGIPTVFADEVKLIGEANTDGSEGATFEDWRNTAANAYVNSQSDWTEADTDHPGFVKNKPQLGEMAFEDKKDWVEEVPEVWSDNIEYTGDTTGTYYTMGVASNGKTYFGTISNGIKVLNDSTGQIENTNVTSDGYRDIGIASNGKTYFCSNNNGIKVLNDSTGQIENTNVTAG